MSDRDTWELIEGAEYGAIDETGAPRAGGMRWRPRPADYRPPARPAGQVHVQRMTLGMLAGRALGVLIRKVAG